MNYDIIIIGTGIGASTIALDLATTGKKILILERGGFIPKEKENWDPIEVVEKGRYRTKEQWIDKSGNPFVPFTYYAVGGNSKAYGAAAFRLRERDFTSYHTPAGHSPAWPLSYTDFKPYYDKAESYMHVHGKRNLDPTEPATDIAYPFPPFAPEPFTKELMENIHQTGIKAYPIPMALQLPQDNGNIDAPLVLGNFDGFPDPTESKSDAHVIAVRPALKNENVTLITGAFVKKLITDSSGNNVKSAIVEIDGENQTFHADLFILGAGAINSAALLLKSTSNVHINGLGNSSGLVGRNYMSHINGCMIAYTPQKFNDAAFQKYFCIGDYYWGDQEYNHPMGEIQLMGKNDPATYLWNPPAPFKDKTAAYISNHTIDFWLTSEDVPQYENKVSLSPQGQIQLTYFREKNNIGSFEQLKLRLKKIMQEVGKIDSALHEIIWGGYDLGIDGVSHQCGTLKFGTDKKTSVLDIHCKMHDLENLFVADASFFPSCGAYNPSLTIAANAFRISDHIKQIL